VVADTLRQSGFRISELSQGSNPVYGIKFSPDAHPVIGFSKTLEHPFNPASGFAAIMTCDSANEACPFVPGAEKRFAITFEDPKAFDQTPQQKEKYSERSLQIATELLYVFTQIKL
jgi:arsenate reductase